MCRHRFHMNFIPFVTTCSKLCTHPCNLLNRSSPVWKFVAVFVQVVCVASSPSVVRC
jgi:hypothetical protein